MHLSHHPIIIITAAGGIDNIFAAATMFKVSSTLLHFLSLPRPLAHQTPVCGRLGTHAHAHMHTNT